MSQTVYYFVNIDTEKTHKSEVIWPLCCSGMTILRDTETGVKHAVPANGLYKSKEDAENMRKWAVQFNLTRKNKD